jgi:hypothetical protein
VAERVFAKWLRKAGFTDVSVADERWLGIDDLEHYPLFTTELLALMRRAIAPERHNALARTMTFTARKP